MRGALKLLGPNKLLGLVDVEPGEKAKLPIVKATVADKINMIRSNLRSNSICFYTNIPCQ